MKGYSVSDQSTTKKDENPPICYRFIRLTRHIEFYIAYSLTDYLFFYYFWPGTLSAN
jgi:hypothetical protein